MRWPWIEKPLGTYALIRKGEAWTLDGILCQGTLGNFNFTDTDKVNDLINAKGKCMVFSKEIHDKIG